MINVVAPPKRKRKPGADEALAEVLAAHAEMREAEQVRADAARRRADAIDRSIELGLTLQEIGDHLGGISKQRVTQMRSFKGEVK